jgi:hypothetical protein
MSVITIFLIITLLSFLYIIQYLNVNRVIYKIKKGTHGPWYDWSLHLGINSFKIKAKFTESCLYDKLDREDDLNKLYGFSLGRHHTNSLRIGWRPSRKYKDEIEIWSYIYTNSERTYRLLKTVTINDWHEYEAHWVDGVITIRITDPSRVDNVYSFIAPQPKTKIGYMLFPFFGGQAPAPHNMKLYIKH